MKAMRPLTAVVVSSLMLGACSKGGSSPESETANTVTSSPETTVVAEPMPPPAPEAPPPESVAAAPSPVEDTPAPTPLTDAQIAKVLEAVDTGEIEQAKVAQKKAKHPRVKKFAQHMIQQHTKAKQKGATLAKKAKLTPEDSPVAAQLTGRATTQLEALKAAEGPEFDRLYIDGQAAQHQEVLDLVNAQLIPAATDEGLKGHLAETRTMVESHVADAKEVSQLLATAGGAAPMTPATTGPGASAPTGTRNDPAGVTGTGRGSVSGSAGRTDATSATSP